MYGKMVGVERNILITFWLRFETHDKSKNAIIALNVDRLWRSLKRPIEAMEKVQFYCRFSANVCFYAIGGLQIMLT